MSRKGTVTTIASKNKLLCAPLNDEAKAVLRRKPLKDRFLLRLLISNKEVPLDDSQIRMLALDALYLRGYRIFDEVL